MHTLLGTEQWVLMGPKASCHYDSWRVFWPLNHFRDCPHPNFSVLLALQHRVYFLFALNGWFFFFEWMIFKSSFSSQHNWEESAKISVDTLAHMVQPTQPSAVNISHLSGTVVLSMNPRGHFIIPQLHGVLSPFCVWRNGSWHVSIIIASFAVVLCANNPQSAACSVPLFITPGNHWFLPASTVPPFPECHGAGTTSGKPFQEGFLPLVISIYLSSIPFFLACLFHLLNSMPCIPNLDGQQFIHLFTC